MQLQRLPLLQLSKQLLLPAHGHLATTQQQLCCDVEANRCDLLRCAVLYGAAMRCALHVAHGCGVCVLCGAVGTKVVLGTAAL